MSIFSSIRGPKLRRNTFNLGHENKLTLDQSWLVPFYWADIVPGDRWFASLAFQMQMLVQKAPVMHRVNVYFHWFFVPYRLVWDDWKTFITGGEDGNQTPIFPRFQINSFTNVLEFMKPGSLCDYLGIPCPQTFGYTKASDSSAWNIIPFNLLPFRAYHLIWNEYYRNQNLQDEFKFSHDSGIFLDLIANNNELANLLTLRRHNWEKDYFTSALPWTQRGGDVSLPIQTTISGTETYDVRYESPGSGSRADHQRYRFFRSTDGTESPVIPGLSGNYDDVQFDQTRTTNDAGANVGGATLSPKSAPDLISDVDPRGTLKVDVDFSRADLDADTMITINDLRRANKLQEWLERNARGGSRYIEQILSHFGVKSSDARLQRPEFLGGGKAPVSFTQVLQTSQTTDTSPQGQQTGYGSAGGSSFGFKKRFEEHGILMGIMFVQPRTAYCQGLPKVFQKFDKFDYYWPEFAHLGEQPIQNMELYMDWKGVDNNLDKLKETFGYTPRYSEYKFEPSRVHGQFLTSLDYWHMARKFANKPSLNSQFVEAQDIRRIYPVVDEDADNHALYCQMYVNLKANRLMPRFGTPML